MTNNSNIFVIFGIIMIVFSGCQKPDFNNYINTWDKKGPVNKKEFIDNIFGNFSPEEKNEFVWDAFLKNEFPELIEMIQNGANGEFEKPDSDINNNPQPFIVFVLKAKNFEVAKVLLKNNISLAKKKRVVINNGKADYDDIAEMVLKSYDPELIKIVFEAATEFFNKQIDNLEPIYHVAGLERNLDVKKELLTYFIEKSDKKYLKYMIDETEYIPDSMNWDEIIDLFIAQGANINEKGAEGNTSLFLKCLSIISIDVGDTKKLDQRLNEVKLFLRHGADPTIRNDEGILPENFLDSWVARNKIKRFSAEDVNKPQQFDPFYLEAQKKVRDILHTK